KIEMLRDVASVSPVAVLTVSASSALSAVNRVNTSAPDSAYGLNIGAMRELSLTAAHALGFTGRGVRMAILDTGFRLDHESLASARIIATRDFIQNDAIVSDQPGDSVGQQDHG